MQGLDRTTIPIKKTRSFTGWSYKEAAINYLDYGKGKCLIFLHGWGGEIASFKGLADRLSHHYRVILVDLYGFGKTPHPDRPLTIEEYATGVKELMNELKVEDPVLVGHSFGGRVAMRIAARDVVVGLILLDSAGILPRRGLTYYWKVAISKIAKFLHLKWRPKGSADYQKLSGVMRQTFVNVVNEDSLPDARRIEVPTLLVWGSADEETPLYMCRKLHRAIEHSEVLIVEGAGHFAYLEQPEYHYRVIRAFREGV